MVQMAHEVDGSLRFKEKDRAVSEVEVDEMFRLCKSS